MRDRIRRRWLGTAVVLAVTAVAAANVATAAAAAKNHKIDARATLATYAMTANTSKDAGPVVGKPIGRGVVDQTTVFNGLAFTSKGTVYGKTGTWRYKASGSATLQPDGSATFTGSAKITGGTGTYRGSTGQFDISGSAASVTATVSNFHATGKIKY
jgi:hypothetical protein